ncbi:MAG: hypothetical protein JWR61_1361 [Ferruginibacter sp.]|uniref:hypothetical protein n=1 Tax=Ferruginibacter sp. TaxID=1940288 RepID=UPI002657B086|nr:hypothetical protein [Ferruginibacter sp.]MDB5276406.1 hypothetical protein [Ferruginibacter sp.]
MKKSQDFTLIEGEFTPQDAKEVLINLYSSKLNFHVMKNFSSNERLGKDDETSTKRIPELKKSMLQITEIIEQAEKKKKKLIITAVVSIEVTNSK